MSQWVRHISGQGEKWEVADDHPSWMTPDAYPNPNIEWLVYGNPRGRLAKRFAQHLLPKSEYVLCDPPERWVDITNECEVSCSDDKQLRWKLTDRKGLNLEQCGPTYEYLPNFTCRENRYRLRKVRMYQTDGTGSKPNCEMVAFIVERKEP